MKNSVFTLFVLFTITFSSAFGQTKSNPRKKHKTTKAKVIRKISRKTKTNRGVNRKTIKTIKMEKINNNAVTTESGLTYIITKKGEGAAVKAGDNVIVNYTGLLTNGAMFDSSVTRNEPFSFPVGAGMVIKGWDEGLQHLHIGDHATLIIPPAIGYGAGGAGGVIPPDATLIFIIEVLGVK